jgi:hypothetical protein
MPPIKMSLISIGLLKLGGILGENNEIYIYKFEE